MTNSINVPRELLENLIEQHITAHGCTTETARQAQLMLSAPSPAGVDGLVAVEWAKDAEEWGPALNEAGWLFLSELNEDPQKSALIFNNCKGPLRAAIMKYAEIVTARRAAAELKQINNYGD